MQIMSNFSSSMKEFLDARQKWASIAELRANTNILMPIGFQAYCEAEASWYVLASATDIKDPSTYSWSKLIPSVDLDSTVEQVLDVTSISEAIGALAASDYIVIEKQSDAEAGYAATYKLKRKNATEDGGFEYLGDSINIPKDMVVQSAEVKTLGEQDDPVAGVAVGEKYIDILIANSDDTHLYINVNDLVDDKSTNISYSYTGEGDVPVYTTVSDMLDILRVFMDTATPKIANLSSEGTLNAEHVIVAVDESTTETVQDSIDSIKGGMISLEEMVNALAVGESIKPEFSSTATKSTFINANGTTISDAKFTVTGTSLNLVEGDITVELYKGAEKIDTQTMSTSTGSVTLSVATDIISTTSFTIKCSYRFAGDKADRTVSVKTYTYTFVNPSYHGIIDDGVVPTESIDTLTRTLKTSAGFTYNGITCTNKKVVFLFPTSIGSISNIKDGNNFDVTDAFESSSVTIDSVAYTQLISKETMTLTNGKLIFA